ncbi:MAG: hypothetical protein JSU89_12780, partial [Myxococcales bacterium]
MDAVVDDGWLVREAHQQLRKRSGGGSDTGRDVDRAAIERSVECSEIRADRLILCAGALGSARIVLQSLDEDNARVPVLTNPYTYVPCFFPARLGLPERDRRTALSQLSG